MSTPYTYNKEYDILSLSTRGDYEESAAIAFDLMADFDTKGCCIGFEFLDAADLFLAYMRPEDYPKPDREGEVLTIEYCAESDTLSFENGNPVSYSETVIDHCIAHLDAEGDPVGFTLEKASERILPLLLTNQRGKVKPSQGGGD